MSFFKNFLLDFTNFGEHKYATWEQNIQKKINQVQGFLTPLMNKNERVTPDHNKKIFLALNDLGQDLVVENFAGDTRSCQLIEQARVSMLNLWTMLLNLVDRVNETRSVVTFLDIIHKIMSRSEFDITHLCLDTSGKPNCRNEYLQTLNRYRVLLLNTQTYIANRMSETKPQSIDSTVVYDLPMVYAKILSVNFFRLPDVGVTIIEQLSNIGGVSFDLRDFEDTYREKVKKEKRRKEKPKLVSRRNVKENIKSLLKDAPKEKDLLNPESTLEIPLDPSQEIIDPLIKSPLIQETSLETTVDEKMPTIPFQNLDPKLQEVISSDPTSLADALLNQNSVESIMPISFPRNPLELNEPKVEKKSPNLDASPIEEKKPEVTSFNTSTEQQIEAEQKKLADIVNSKMEDTQKNTQNVSTTEDTTQKSLPEIVQSPNQNNQKSTTSNQETNPIGVAPNTENITKAETNNEDQSPTTRPRKGATALLKKRPSESDTKNKGNGILVKDNLLEDLSKKKKTTQIVKVDGSTCEIEENIQNLIITFSVDNDKNNERLDLIDTLPRLFSWAHFHSSLQAENDRNSANTQSSSRDALLSTPMSKTWVQNWFNSNSILVILFIKEWVEHVEKMSKVPMLIAFSGKTVAKVVPPYASLNWKMIVGYKPVIEAFLSVLRHQSNIAKPLMSCSIFLLHCEPLLINYYLHHTCSRTISYQLQAVMGAFTKIFTWFSEFKELNRPLPKKFDIKYYCAALDAVLATDHHQFICRVLQLIYDTCEIFTGEVRKYFISEFLLKKYFYKLFLHWDEITRNYFQQLLIFKVIRIKRSQLQNGLTTPELSFIGKEKYSFKDVDAEVEFSNDQAIFAKIECYIQVVQDQLRDLNASGYEKSLEIYAPRAMGEYRFFLSKYHAWENTDVEWKLVPLAILDSRRGTVPLKQE